MTKSSSRQTLNTAVGAAAAATANSQSKSSTRRKPDAGASPPTNHSPPQVLFLGGRETHDMFRVFLEPKAGGRLGPETSLLFCRAWVYHLVPLFQSQLVWVRAMWKSIKQSRPSVDFVSSYRDRRARNRLSRAHSTTCSDRVASRPIAIAIACA
jgi:hypothetical protein